MTPCAQDMRQSRLHDRALEKRRAEMESELARLETDYAAEDSQNLLTRLEAFKHTLEGDVQ